MSNKPYAAAAEQNRHDILSVLTEEFKDARCVLEIGSGTGQHAVYIAQHLSHLNWQCSDKKEMLTGINLWIDESALDNVPQAIELDVCKPWSKQIYDAAFGANIAHIMHSHELEKMFAGLGQCLSAHAHFCLYGPFNVNGEYTSDSNREFDLWLKSRDPESCIRDKEYLDSLAELNQLTPANSYQMPSNNMILCWQKS
ncbi:MAG: DUF938 domain-containing protein [Pseudomonadota bacterium]